MDNNGQGESISQPGAAQSQQPVPQYQPVHQPPASQSPKPSSNLPLIIFSAAIFLFAIAAVVYVLGLGKSNNSKTQKTNTTIVSPTVASQEVAPSSQVVNNGGVTISPQVTGTVTKAASASPVPRLTEGTVPAGYVKKTTLCYTTLVPQDATVGKDNGCRQYITNSTLKPYVYTEQISPVFANSKYHSLDDLVSKRIPVYNKLAKDENIVLDGVPARKLTEENSKLKLSFVRVFVYLPNKYQASGVKLAGFEITTTLDGNDSRTEQAHDSQVFETLLSNWKWQ